MKLANFVATNENMGQESEDDLETMQAGHESTLLEAEAVSNGETDIAGNEAAIEDIDQGLSAVETSSDLIEEAKDTLTNDEAADGMATDAEIISVESLISSIRSNLGVEQAPVSTLESRRTMKRSDLVATLEAEGASMGARAVAGIKALINAVVSFFRQLFQNVGSLEKYVDGLKKQVAAYKEGEAKEGKVSAKFASAQAATEAMSGVNKLMTVAEQTIAKYEGVVKENKDKEFTTDDKFDTFFEQAKTEAHNQVKDIVFANGQKLGEDFKPTGDAAGGESARLSKAEMTSVINAAASAVTSLKNARKVENKLVTFGKNVMAFFSIAGNSAGATFRGEEGKAKSRKNINNTLFATAYRQIVNIFGRSVPSFAFKNVKAAADYVKASLA